MSAAQTQTLSIFCALCPLAASFPSWWHSLRWGGHGEGGGGVPRHTVPSALAASHWAVCPRLNQPWHLDCTDPSPLGLFGGSGGVGGALCHRSIDTMIGSVTWLEETVEE